MLKEALGSLLSLQTCQNCSDSLYWATLIGPSAVVGKKEEGLLHLLRNLMLMRVIIAALAVTLALLVSNAGCTEAETRSPEIRILSHGMTVHEFAGAGPQSSAVVVGRAQSISTMDIRVAVVTVNFYDKNKQLMATASAVKENLRPGEVWDFTVKTIGPDAWKIVSYDISASTRQ